MHRPHLPLALGATLLALGALGTGVALASPAGEPDTLFNGGVPARIDFGNDAFLSTMALAPDGSIFTGAGRFGADSSVLLSHLGADGAPVAGFGPGGDGVVTDAVAGLSSPPEAMVVAADGDLLVGLSATAVLPQEARATGRSTNKLAPGAWGTNDQSVIGDVTVERYDATGTRVGETRVNVDPANDDGGYHDAKIVALVSQADGSLLVLGSAWVGGDEHFVRVLLGADGRPVSTFGDDGVAVDADATQYAEVGGHQAAGGPAGSVVIAGMSGNDDYVLRRYLADGSVDPAYGGTFPHANIHSMSITSAALAPDGSLYIYNTAVGAIARFTPDGKPDNSYAPTFDQDEDIIIYALAVQADGRLLLAGRTADGRSAATVTRLNTDGSVDATYGDAGTLTLPLADDLTGMTPSVLAVQADGKAVLGGDAYHYPPLELRARSAALEPGQSVGFVTRLTADPPAPPTDTTTTTPPAPTAPAPVVAQPVAAASANPLPPATSCVSRRSFRIRLRIPRGDVATSATVKVNGKQVKVVKGSRVRAPIALRGLPKGKATVSIVVKVAGRGKPLTGTRVYHTCTAKRTGSVPRL